MAVTMTDELVDATPVTRDRVVDFLRVTSIAVVVLWHWTFSITHWRDGELVMPNPIADVPGLWAATWLLQVMPLFFLVGGYANLAGWQSMGDARMFWRRRFARLLRPVGLYVMVWAIVDLAWPGTSVLDWGMVVFVPLWFLAVYMGVVALVPVTARLHAARPVATLVALGAGIAAADVARLGFGVEGVGLAGSALVWVFCHQLGYFWRDGRGTAWAVAATGLGGLIALTTFGPYSRSMVAVRGEGVSNMNPTTACIAALAVFQLGVVLLVAGRLRSWLQRRSVWRVVVAANGVSMTVFCWHMTALVGFLLAYEAAGFGLRDDPTAGWWLTRPLWIAGPGVLLAGLLAVFARFELPTRNLGPDVRGRGSSHPGAHRGERGARRRDHRPVAGRRARTAGVGGS